MAQRLTINGQPVDNNMTDIVERPAIVDKDGKISFFTPEMEMLDTPQLKYIANMMGGTLVYRKFRVEYKEVEARFCDYRGCFSLADGTSGYCGKHEKVIHGQG